MARATRINLLPIEDAAYIAGLVDGEGTVTLTHLHSNENRRLVDCIASTEIQLLQFVLEHCGVGKITRKKANSDWHSPSFCYCITSRQALALLKQIAPHMRSYNRKRAELALREYESVTPRNGKYSPGILARRMNFEQRLLELQANGLRNVSARLLR